MSKTKVLVIVGPTSSGKSDLAVYLAKRFNGEIVSADSRQVYKGLDVGSGKITAKEMQSIPHHLLDVADPKNQFSASDYKKLAGVAIDDIVRRGKLPIVAGGTGFYIDVLTGNTSLPEVPPNPQLRRKLERKNTRELFKLLKQLDPRRADVIDQHNKPRLVRALEIIETLGHVPPIIPPRPSKYEYIYIGLKPDDDSLDKRIRKRLRMRLSGIIEEAEKLHKQGLSYKRMHELGLEYRHAAMYLEKKLVKQTMAIMLYKESRQYAKRQMTWFRRNKDIKWFTLNRVNGFKLAEEEQIEKYVENML